MFCINWTDCQLLKSFFGCCSPPPPPWSKLSHVHGPALPPQFTNLFEINYECHHRRYNITIYTICGAISLNRLHPHFVQS